MILIMLLLISCATVEKRLEALFKAEYSTNLDEKFSKTLDEIKKEIKNFNLKKVRGGERVFNLKTSDKVEKIISHFRGYDLDLDIDTYIYKIPNKTKGFEFPETIIFNEKSKDAVVISYDFKTRQFLEIFRTEDYDLSKFKIYCNVFKDLSGTAMFMLNEHLNYVDITPFKTRTSFCTPKIGFRKTDFFVNKGYITNSYTNRDFSGLYTAIYVDTTKNRYEVPLFNYLIKAVEDKIEQHILKSYSMYDFFFDEYEETPYFEKLKEQLFKISVCSIDLFEFISYYHLGKYAALNPYDKEEVSKINKDLTKAKEEEMIKDYDKEVNAAIKLLNNVVAQMEESSSWNDIKWNIYSKIKNDAAFKYLKFNKNVFINTVYQIYYLNIL